MSLQTNIQSRTDCLDCGSRTSEYFCTLPEDASRNFKLVRIAHSYPRGTTLFAEGQPANGVYVICSGRIKLSTYSPDGKALIIRVCEAGEVLGLGACVAGLSHEATAQVIEDCRVNFIRRDEFLNLLSGSSEAAFNALRELSRNYHHAHMQICSLGLSMSAGDKLAKLFLEWFDHAPESANGVHISMIYTHEELAEMIGSSRETVTRLLKNFVKRGLIVLNRNDLFIPDRKKLSGAIGARHAKM
jgi:CRP/FNR family cyclic AMP-dependent transcriptional regulator